MKNPTFGIFRGFLINGGHWVESIDGLGAAAQRMFQLSVIRPGPYFVFDNKQHKVLASTDTSPKHKPPTRTSEKKQVIGDVA